MRRFAHIDRLICFAFCLAILFPDNNLLATNVNKDRVLTQKDRFNPGIFIFQKDVDEVKFNEEHLQLYKEQAILAAENDDVLSASIYAEYYVKYSSEVGFIDSGFFTKFKDTEEFSVLYDKYSINFSWLKFFYLFSSLVGIFIFLLLMFKRQRDKIATSLIGGFVLINSLFILHIFLFLTNLKFRTPHILYMSSLTIYLYGPLIYFYFKRIALNYKFKKWDALHLVPTLMILVIFFPVFLLPAQEKLNIMLDVGAFDRRPYLLFTVSTKILSLLVYGGLLLRMYVKNKERLLRFTPSQQKWMRTMVIFVEIYVLAYLIYGIILMNVIPHFDFLSNVQISIIASMVLYIGYTSYLQPNLFAVKTGLTSAKKYYKSSLTPSYSSELKDKLVYLLETEKIYRQNTINLDILSEKLDTTRHNASQVINENFNLSFFELINTYRIKDALEILKNDTEKKMNIIEVAYEVGFNNKVSFNKSFKKFRDQTPSQYISSLGM
jgi:AraC-like DNA-binding protein